MGEPAESPQYALVVTHGDTRVKLHSRVSKHVEVPLSEEFLDTLRLFTNENMWDLMHLEDDRE